MAQDNTIFVPHCDTGALGDRPLPVRKRLDHRGPLSIDVTGAWYFITICAEGHRPWVGGDHRAPRDTNHSPSLVLDEIANLILDEARFFHVHRKWFLALMLVMPDHLHCIVHGAPGGRPLPLVIGDFKRYLNGQFGICFQENFWDTRLRDEAHYAEKFRYICNNPVRKGLCSTAREWPHVIAFDRQSGEERMRR